MKTKESYLPGYTANASNFMAFRTAQSHAAFVLPKLRPGLRLLDCGCGPGSITLGLARLVSPAEVVGLDRENSQVEKARKDATNQGVSNVRFEVGSVYELPFAEGSFDVVFAHAVFEHLREPLSALSEIRRILASEGLVALRSPDWGGFLVSPMTPQLDAALDYYQSLQTESGGDVHVGRKFKALLREVGFRDSEFSASYECYRSLESIGEYLAQRIESSSETAATPNDKQRIESFATALRDWYRCEDAVFAQSWCEILGRK
ncbi:MAG: methyltransferase domain-containing protein [Verrucomicrobiales bacterium]|nr:methyltransferase domain-containing protein [Verrucomicrobiales bacterium]